MRLRRFLALLAVPALAVGLTACGPGDSADPPTAEGATSQEESPTSEDPPAEESPAEESSSADGSTSDPADSDPAESDPAEETTSDEATTGEEPESQGTAIESLWIDDSWTIEQVDEDLCEMGGGYPSQYSEQADIFVCGPMAAGAEACAVEDGTVQCIVDPIGKQAIEFDSPTAPEQLEPREDEALPLLVELPDGAVCATIAHDHDQHWEGLFSWYRCDDGSELLTTEEIGETFDRGEPWTVQRSVDQGEPEETAVSVAVFAGR